MDTKIVTPTTDTIKDDATPSKDENGKDKELISVGKGKEKIIFSNDIELEEEIVISNWDLSNLFSKKINILGEIWKKRAR